MDCFELPELLDELSIILIPQAKAKGQTLATHVKGAPPERIIGDRLRLNQILINLLSNAIKYTPEGGRIDFIISEIKLSSNQYTKLRFVVKDNGIGMSEDYVKQIFVPFSREISSLTNKIQGTGLGMAITKSLVDLMGGIINVESEPGKGSTFSVELTFSLPEQGEDESWLRQNISRILVVDDEEDVCLNIKDLMNKIGIEVYYATESSAAVDEAVKAHESGKDFDVILIDRKMPERDGVDTARAICQQIGEGVPIPVLTSYDWNEIESEARSAGINAFMAKPFFVSTFRQAIKPLFAKQAENSSNEINELHESVLAGRNLLVA